MRVTLAINELITEAKFGDDLLICVMWRHKSVWLRRIVQTSITVSQEPYVFSNDYRFSF